MIALPSQTRPTQTRPAPLTLPEDARTLLVVPAVVGVALGIGDLVAMNHIGYPWANLANASAVWALGAFLLGVGLRTDPLRSAVAGVVMLLVAVEAYYLWAVLTDQAGTATLWSANTRMWLVFGVCAGTVFGIAGSWVTQGEWWQKVVAAATGGGVLLGEALHIWAGLGWTTLSQPGSGYHLDLAWTGLLLAGLGVGVVVATGRTPRVLAPALALSVPTALFFAAAFSAVGIAA
ncbi:uncharacterized membrane protein (UPF0136 family) [Marmoricola sp. OAE513]|uniref:DUF6518 family protein n=1 Tax=Marmoricola sp. OAE513 TaxID=2817894 RepID=UPI001AE25A99